MCIKCRSHKPIPEDDMQESDTDFVAVENVREHLDQSFTANGLSPCKLPKISSRDKEGYIKRKVKQVEEKTKDLLCQVAGIPSESLDIHTPTASISSVSESDVDYLVQAIKQKLSLATGNQEKLKLLTLAPMTWTIAKTVAEFGESEYLVCRARDLRKDHGILPDVTYCLGKPLETGTVDKVVAFFNDDNVSRLMPGKKDEEKKVPHWFTNRKDLF